MTDPRATPTPSVAAASARINELLQGGSANLTELLALRLDPNWSVRREVVAALGALGDAALPSLCESLLRERDDETRIAATVDALSASQGDAESALRPFAQLQSAAVLADVANILGRRGKRSSLGTLAQLVEHDDDNVAVAAIEALGRVGGRRVVDVLVKAVESRRFFRCFAAIDVLGRSGDPRAIAPLVALLDNSQCGFEALRALGRTGDRAAVPALARLLAAPSDGVVRAAAQALAELCQKYGEHLGTTLPVEEALRRATPDSATRRLTQCISKADTGEQIAILVVLGYLRDEAATPTLLQALDSSPTVAAMAAEMLQRIATDSEAQWIEAVKNGNSARRQALLPILSRSGAASAVVACLHDASPTVRRLACESLARIGKTDEVPALFAALQDSSPAVVQAAVAAITALGSAETPALATQRAAADAPNVRRAALRILAYTGRADALPTLETGTRDVDARVRDAAIQGVALLDTPDALEVLLALARDATPATRASAQRALGALQWQARIEAQLVAGILDEDAWVRYYACQALGRLGASGSIEAVVRLLEDAAGQVRVAAVEALARLGGERSFTALRDAAASTDTDQRRAALIGLGLSRRPEAAATLLEHVDSADVATRLIAISALANIRTPETLSALGRALHDPDDSVRAAAVGLLGTFDPIEATQLLAARLTDPNCADRVASVLSERHGARVAGISAALQAADDEHALQLTHILARMNHPEATAALFEALTLPNVAARKAAATTLAAIGSSEAMSLLRRLGQEDSDAEVRRVCLLLLSQ